MNTGTILETKRLILLPSENSRDNDSFLYMLRADGDFEQYCGVPFSEKNLKRFANYLEHRDTAYYSIFLKNSLETFIGYVGCEYHVDNRRYEIEFYVGKQHRNIGICTEAASIVLQNLFETGLSMDKKIVKIDKIYAETLIRNEATKQVLYKLGFEKYVPEDGPIMVAKGFCDDEADELFMIRTEDFVLTSSKYQEGIE